MAMATPMPTPPPPAAAAEGRWADGVLAACAVRHGARERHPRMGCRSGGVHAHVGVRAALEARPVPSGLGAAREPCGVTRGRSESAQEARPGTTSKPVLCAFTFPGARASGEQCGGQGVVPAARGGQGGCVCGS